mgnify:FL=1
MMTLEDLEKMTKDELEALIKDASKAMKTVDARQRKAALEAAKAAAAEHGFDLGELTESKLPKTKSSVKYRDPDNAENEWSGRGRQPQWFKDKIAAGVATETLAV